MRGAGRRDWRQEEVRGRRRGGCTYQKKNQHPDKLYAAGYTYRISGPRRPSSHSLFPSFPSQTTRVHACCWTVIIIIINIIRLMLRIICHYQLHFSILGSRSLILRFFPPFAAPDRTWEQVGNQIKSLLMSYRGRFLAPVPEAFHIECSACGIRQNISSDSPLTVRFCLGMWPRRTCECCCNCSRCIDMYRDLVRASVFNYLANPDDKYRSL